MCESHIVLVHCICSLLYMPLTQILGIVVHYNKFYSILFYSILFYSILFYSILFYSIYIFIAIALDESNFLDVLHFPMKNIKSRDPRGHAFGRGDVKTSQ